MKHLVTQVIVALVVEQGALIIAAVFLLCQLCRYVLLNATQAVMNYAPCTITSKVSLFSISLCPSHWKTARNRLRPSHCCSQQLKHQPLSRCNRHVIQFVSHIRAIYTGTNKVTQTAPFIRAYVLSKIETALIKFNGSRLISVLVRLVFIWMLPIAMAIQHTCTFQSYGIMFSHQKLTHAYYMPSRLM